MNEVYIINGEAMTLVPPGDGAPGGEAPGVLAMPVLVVLYVPYILNMILQKFTSQMFYVFVTDNLDSTIDTIGYINIARTVVSLVCGFCFLDKMTSSVTNRHGIVLGHIVSLVSTLGIMVSPNIWWFALAQFTTSLSFSGWSSYHSKWIMRGGDRLRSSSLQVAMRYLGGLLGVPAGLAILQLTGNIRAVYFAKMVGHLLVAAWVYASIRVCCPIVSVAGPRARGQRAEGRAAMGNTILALLREYPDLRRTFLKIVAFNMFTEAVRGGYENTLNLKAITTKNIGKAATALALSTSNGIAMSGIFATPMLVEGNLFGFRFGQHSMRRAALLSFSLLALGHFVLADSESLTQLTVTGVLFGLGEAFSCGLRSNVKSDFRTTLRAAGLGDAEENMFLKGVGRFVDLVAMLNKGLTPIVGHYFGMTAVSAMYGVIGCLAVVFSLSPLLPTGEDDEDRPSADAERYHGDATIVYSPCCAVRR